MILPLATGQYHIVIYCPGGIFDLRHRSMGYKQYYRRGLELQWLVLHGLRFRVPIVCHTQELEQPLYLLHMFVP